MPAPDSEQSSLSERQEWFATTHWSVVLAAREMESPEAFEALNRLCRTYWYPTYAFIRQQGHRPHDAQDLTQGFFARLLEKDFLKNVAPQKGKFRSFLLAAVKHFLANQWDRTQAVRRGAEYELVSWDIESVERRYGAEPESSAVPDQAFDRRWALTLLENVIGKLRQDYHAAGKARLFEVLEEYLSAPTGRQAYAEEARRLDMSEGAVKVAVHRLRRRYGELLRAEIAHTVAMPADIDEEIRYLFSNVRL